MKIDLRHGDCLDRLDELEAGSITMSVSDPPYDLTSSGKGGFMGKDWDGTGIAFSSAFWDRMFRVVAPGGIVKAFGGTRTFHRMAAAMEKAGFVLEPDDSLEAWTYGSGFPKSLNVSKALDKMRHNPSEVREVCGWLRERASDSGVTSQQIADEFGFDTRMVRHWTAGPSDSQPSVPHLGVWNQLLTLLGMEPGDVPERIQQLAVEMNSGKWEPSSDFFEREILAQGQSGTTAIWNEDGGMGEFDVTAPKSEAAVRWDGWGTALKPAWEPILVGRKPSVE